MSAYGVPCPVCSSRRAKTKDSRPGGGNMTWRRRHCFDCKTIFTTYEISAEEYQRLAGLEQNFIKAKASLQAVIDSLQKETRQ
jgi:transcriptional regulator NrdR family protein